MEGTFPNPDVLGYLEDPVPWELGILDLLPREQENTLTSGQFKGAVFSHSPQVLRVWGTCRPNQPEGRTEGRSAVLSV